MHGNVSLPVGSLTTVLSLEQVLLWAGESLVYPQKAWCGHKRMPHEPRCKVRNNLPSAPKVARGPEEPPQHPLLSTPGRHQPQQALRACSPGMGLPVSLSNVFHFISIWKEMSEEGRPTYHPPLGDTRAGCHLRARWQLAGPCLSCPKQWREWGGFDLAARSDKEPGPNGCVVVRRRSPVLLGRGGEKAAGWGSPASRGQPTAYYYLSDYKPCTCSFLSC